MVALSCTRPTFGVGGSITWLAGLVERISGSEVDFGCTRNQVNGDLWLLAPNLEVHSRTLRVVIGLSIERGLGKSGGYSNCAFRLSRRDFVPKN